jgi:hypothetical protein
MPTARVVHPQPYPVSWRRPCPRAMDELTLLWLELHLVGTCPLLIHLPGLLKYPAVLGRG